MPTVRGAAMALLLIVGCVSTAAAELLGISAGTNVPNLTFSAGAVSYDAATGTFQVTATPVAVMVTAGQPPRFINSAAPRSLALRFIVDAAGRVVAGTAGDDLVVVGEILGEGLSGTLLTGEIVAFGFKDFGTATDAYDVRLRLTGGLLGPQYAGRDIGVTVSSQSSTFVGLFTENFGGQANGNVFPLFNANAGPDQTVYEGEMVTLDGTVSAGPGLSFFWQQMAGPAAALNDAGSATPAFTAPQLPGGLGSQALTFQLTVTSGGLTDTDTVDVVVRNVNHPPVAVASAPSPVNEDSVVTMSGHDSYDPDVDTITYQWVQIAGPTVALSGADAPQASFIAPGLPAGTASASLQFQLTVSDGALWHSTSVTVIVEHVNHLPVANAGADRTVASGSLVTLDGGASSDPDGDMLAFQWSQTGGPAVTLSGAAGAMPTFVAPGAAATLTFSLVVRDPYGAVSAPDAGTITVVRANDAPRCDRAVASPGLLWPPNHKMVAVEIRGLTDPNNDKVTVTIDSVRQDEPVNGLGDGDTSPDAVIRGQGVLLRAERSGVGNGRVYHIAYSATDVWGASCTGVVRVGVPHSRNRGPIDGGPLYDSTQP